MNKQTKKLAQVALLLAICILSQYFKNLSTYITGPIINACLLIAVLAIDVKFGVLLSIITPVTAFFITGSPIIAGIPLMLPVIMIGNSILVVATYFFYHKSKTKKNIILGMAVGSIVKAGFMWIMTSYVLFPIFGENIASHLPKPEALQMILKTAKVTFSITQLITAVIGSILAYVIWLSLKTYLQNENS
ncbi:MAG: ECF transporter S component [Lachnospiraceae bacterium]